MGKSRDVFKKIRHTKETFHAKMGSIKDRKGMDLTEAKDTKQILNMLQKKGPLPGPETGLLSNTQK